MNDQDLRQHVINELDFEPSVDAAHIGVAAENGIVTLNGHVASYAEKIAAEHAARRVRGVRGVAQEIEVRFASDPKTADDQIAKRVLDIIAWSSTIPREALQVEVSKGWVTITGKVNWNYQRLNAENAVRRLSGVVGVNNLIEVVPSIQASNVKAGIEAALKRSAELEASGIKVGVDGNAVTLNGRVRTWYESDAVERAAWSVPGVQTVENQLQVDYG